MTTERKYKGSLKLGELELRLETHEASFGTLIKLEVLNGWTIGTFDDSDYPADNTLALLPSIGSAAPPAPPHASHLFDGQGVVLGASIAISVFRTR